MDKSKSTYARYIFYTIPVLVILSGVALGISRYQAEETDSQDSNPAEAEMDMSAYPDYVQTASSSVQQAYHFAVENPDILNYQPCYCGCGNMDIGHTSNLSCYVKEVQADGTVIFDDHASGCGICVDITLDVIRLMDEGMSQPDIRTYIDNRYSPYGPSTDTDLPPG